LEPVEPEGMQRKNFSRKSDQWPNY
jgi:hypothetical protein